MKECNQDGCRYHNILLERSTCWMHQLLRGSFLHETVPNQDRGRHPNILLERSTYWMHQLLRGSFLYARVRNQDHGGYSNILWWSTCWMRQYSIVICMNEAEPRPWYVFQFRDNRLTYCHQLLQDSYLYQVASQDRGKYPNFLLERSTLNASLLWCSFGTKERRTKTAVSIPIFSRAIDLLNASIAAV